MGSKKRIALLVEEHKKLQAEAVMKLVIAGYATRRDAAFDLSSEADRLCDTCARTVTCTIYYQNMKGTLLDPLPDLCEECHELFIKFSNALERT